MKLLNKVDIEIIQCLQSIYTPSLSSIRHKLSFKISFSQVNIYSMSCNVEMTVKSCSCGIGLKTE